MRLSFRGIHRADQQLPGAVAILHAAYRKHGKVRPLLVNAYQQIVNSENRKLRFYPSSLFEELTQGVLINESAACQAKHYKPQTKNQPGPKMSDADQPTKTPLWLCSNKEAN